MNRNQTCYNYKGIVDAIIDDVANSCWIMMMTTWLLTGFTDDDFMEHRAFKLHVSFKEHRLI